MYHTQNWFTSSWPSLTLEGVLAKEDVDHSHVFLPGIVGGWTRLGDRRRGFVEWFVVEVSVITWRAVSPADPQKVSIVIINFCDKNVVIGRFHDKNDVFIFMTKCHDLSWYFIPILFYWLTFWSIDSLSILSIAIFFYRQLFCSIDSFSVLSIAFLFYP